jgi:hypothetical protein
MTWSERWLERTAERIGLLSGTGRNGEGEQSIVWAETRGQGRTAVAHELEIEYLEVEDFRRIAELDDFKGDLLQWQIDNEWRWECCECGKWAGKDYGYVIFVPAPKLVPENGLTLARHPYVLCSEACCAKHQAWHNERDRVERECLEEFARLHPGVPATGTICNEYNWLVYAGAPLNKLVTVRKFPSEKTG